MAQQPEKQHLILQQNISNALKSLQQNPSYAAMQQEAKLRQQMRYQQELIAMQILKQQKLQQQEAARLMQMQKQMQQQQQLQQQQKQMMSNDDSSMPKLQVSKCVTSNREKKIMEDNKMFLSQSELILVGRTSTLAYKQNHF